MQVFFPFGQRVNKFAFLTFQQKINNHLETILHLEVSFDAKWCTLIICVNDIEKFFNESISILTHKKIGKYEPILQGI